jgi:hypothetical protein
MGLHYMTPKHHEVCRDILKKLESVQNIRHVGLREIFGDFCTIAMAAYHNLHYSIGGRAVPEHYRAAHDKLESDFTDTLAKYDKDGKAHDIFSNALAALVLAMNESPFDYLGKIYMDAEIGNKSNSQFFTPSHICEMMAAMTIHDKDEFDQQVSERGYIGMADPCCGSGAMTIGLVKVLSKYGVEGLGGKLLVLLTDIDYTCVKMAFVQMSILGVAARVVWGDSLSLRVDGQYHTPNMQIALASGRFRSVSDEPPQEQFPPVKTPARTQQLSLF